MKRFIKYPSIEQFRAVVKNLTQAVRFVGVDDNGKALYSQTAVLPTVNVQATEKIHGTNASVCFSAPDGFWVQKRTSICTPEEDNAGCAFAATQKQTQWMNVIHRLAQFHNIDMHQNIITVYYEWCGGNIQKNSAVSSLDKMAIIFAHFKVSPIEPSEEINAFWLPTTSNGEPVEFEEYGIHNILSFPTYEVEVNFNNPINAQNKMVELIETVIEPNSPVGKQLGVDGNVGEGVVFAFTYENKTYRWKVKGEKHSATKVKVLKPVDEVRLQKIQDLSQKVTTACRLEQMFDLANDTINGGQPDIKNLGKFIKFVMNDIIKEESDVIADAGFEPRDMGKVIPQIVRPWYQEQLDKLYMS